MSAPPHAASGGVGDQGVLLELLCLSCAGGEQSSSSVPGIRRDATVRSPPSLFHKRGIYSFGIRGNIRCIESRTWPGLLAGPLSLSVLVMQYFVPGRLRAGDRAVDGMTLS